MWCFTIWKSRPDFITGSLRCFVKATRNQPPTLPRDAYYKGNVLELHEVLQDSSRPELAPEPHSGPFNMH